MDLIAYLILLAGIGLYKMNMSHSEAADTLITQPGEAVIEMVSVPIGDNLMLYKEQDAYTLILEELGLK